MIKVIMLINSNGVVLFSVWVMLMIELVSMFGSVSGSIWCSIICILDVFRVRVFLCIEGGIVLIVVWLVIMIVGRVINVSIRLFSNGIECGNLNKLIKIVRFSRLKIIDGIVVRLLMFILMKLVNLLCGVNFFR